MPKIVLKFGGAVLKEIPLDVMLNSKEQIDEKAITIGRDQKNDIGVSP